LALGRDAIGDVGDRKAIAGDELPAFQFAVHPVQPRLDRLAL
jgi:hypothetical protein